MNQNREPRPDQEMENHLGSWLTDTDLKPDEADGGLERLLETFPTTPQARYRFLGRWFDRDEGARRRTDEHDYPPDQDSRRNRLMFSTTGLVAAIAVLALAVNVVNTDPAPPGAGTGSTYTVAPSGGDFSTITEAVEAASDGDTILVKPGTYTEAVVIEADITLTGDGPREDIVIHAPTGGPILGTSRSGSSREPYSEPYAVLLVDTEATLSGLTFQGEGAVVIASGGAPTLTGLVVDGVGVAYAGDAGAAGNSIVVNGGSMATIRDNTLIDGGAIGVFGLSEPLIVGNILTGGPHIWGPSGDGFGDGTIIRENRIDGSLVRGIHVGNLSSLTIEGNRITNPGSSGIGLLGGGSPTVNDNVISGSTGAGIFVSGRGEATISGNELTDNGAGIIWSRASGLVEGNTVSDGATGIVIARGSPLVRDNVVTGVEGRGLSVGQGTSPTLTGNSSCDNGTNLFVADQAEPVMEDNDICEDTPAE